MSFSYDTPSHPLVDVTIAGIGDPWTEQRRNVFPDPLFTNVSTTGVFYQWQRCTPTSVDGVMSVPRTSSGGASGPLGVVVGVLSPGDVVTFSARRFLPNGPVSAGGTNPGGLRYALYAGGTQGPSEVQITPPDRDTDDIYLSETFTVPEGYDGLGFRFHSGGAVGDVVNWAEPIIEVSGRRLPFFIPGIDEDRRRTRWVGPVNASASVEEVRAQGDVLRASGGTVTLDENYSPYVSSSVMVPLTAPDLGERIDPRTDQRVTITVADESLEFLPPRTFDLGIRDRTVDHGQQTLTIEAASDEARLHDTCRLATTADRTARAYEGSLRGIVNWALEKIGAELEPGGPDRDMTASWDQTNLVTNANGRVDTSGWGTTATGGVVMGPVARRDTGPIEDDFREGAYFATYLRAAATTAGTGIACLRRGTNTDTNITGLIEGRLYTASAFILQNSGTVKTGRIWLGFKNDTNGTIKSYEQTVALPSGTWTKVTVTAVAPVNTSAAALELGVSDGLASGNYVAATGVMLAEGVENDRWYDGDRPDEARYVYDYTPEAGTPSTRVALDPREPDMFSWDPGESLFDFLRPFLEASGLRLFCDESRRWWLVEPAATDWGELVEAFATGAGGYSGTGNTVAGTDVISRDRDDWATGVVVAYTWRTANGDRRTQYDAAGTPGKVVTIERATAYPGPGAAEAILAAMSKRGRTQSATITRGFQASPGYGSRVSLPGTDTQDGRIRRVVLELATGNAQISTNGTETP